MNCGVFIASCLLLIPHLQRSAPSRRASGERRQELEWPRPAARSPATSPASTWGPPRPRLGRLRGQTAHTPGLEIGLTIKRDESHSCFRGCFFKLPMIVLSWIGRYTISTCGLSWVVRGLTPPWGGMKVRGGNEAVRWSWAARVSQGVQLVWSPVPGRWAFPPDGEPQACFWVPAAHSSHSFLPDFQSIKRGAARGISRTLF